MHQLNVRRTMDSYDIPPNGKQWKRFDAKFPDFGDETRNIRFVLSTDGMNPFGDHNSSHST
jgi:hypothetical protein